MKNLERFTLKKDESLAGNIRIDNLFSKGTSFLSYPFRIIYILDIAKTKPLGSVSMLVSVPKKRLKSAVKRNRIKRLVREIYRLNKHMLFTDTLANIQLDIAFIYVKNDIASYNDVEKSILKALKIIIENLNVKPGENEVSI